MVSLTGIQKAHPRMTYRHIYQLIYPRHRERVFRTSLIEIYKVHTHAPLSCFLFHHYCISQPLRIKHLFDSPCLLEFCYLILDNFYMFPGWTPRWLSSRNDGWINIQMMTNEIWIYPRGFISVPCKHINIFSQKINQLLLLQ